MQLLIVQAGDDQRYFGNVRSLPQTCKLQNVGDISALWYETLAVWVMAPGLVFTLIELALGRNVGESDGIMAPLCETGHRRLV
jgi:hypothetical protein